MQLAYRLDSCHVLQVVLVLHRGSYSDTKRYAIVTRSIIVVALLVYIYIDIVMVHAVYIIPLRSNRALYARATL